MNNLNSLSIDELRLVADKLKIKYHHLAKEETLIKLINQQNESRIEDAMKHPAQVEVQPVKYNTQEEILKAVEKYIEKGVQVDFDEADNTWTFRYNGREECGNMSVPIRTIVQKADNVSKGKLMPRGFRDGKDTVLWA